MSFGKGCSFYIEQRLTRKMWNFNAIYARMHFKCVHQNNDNNFNQTVCLVSSLISISISFYGKETIFALD